MPAVYLPSDEFSGNTPPNLDLAADYLELKAALSIDKQAFSEDIVNALELSAEEEFPDVDAEIQSREDVASGAIVRMALRKRMLTASYPFDLDDRGDTVFFTTAQLNLGQTAYLISLLLSNLRALSPLLDGSDLHPSDCEVRELRQYFQYFATAAIAAEVGGPAWSFGHPRPDGAGFMKKLSEIWAILKDGSVKADPGAPAAPKDDKVDIFAWREQPDGLPGFLLVAAQVATGRDWKEKSLKSHISGVFQSRWFNRQPVTIFVPFHVIPFAQSDEKFRDNVLVLGNVMHRLRVPRRVRQAENLVDSGVPIEAFDQLEIAKSWVSSYIEKARTV